MSLTLQCGCGKKFAAPDEQAGKRGKCTNCGRIHQLPLSPAVSTDPASAAVPSKPARPWLSKLFAGRTEQVQAADQSVRIAQWLAQLQSPTPALWQAAMIGLAGLGDETAVAAIMSLGAPPLEPLLDAVQSEHSDRRRVAAQTLGKVKHPWSVDALLWAIEHPLTESRINWTVGSEETNEPGRTLLYAVDYLYAALREMGHVAADRLLPCLEPKHRACFAAIEALRQQRDVRAISGLVAILEHGDAVLRVAAEEALSHLNWRPATDVEMKARRFARYFVAAEWERLRRLGPEAVACAASYFIACSQTGPESDSPGDPNTGSLARTLGNPVPERISREKAVFALGELRDPIAVEPLIAVAGLARREAKAEIDKYMGDPQTKAYVARQALEFQFRIGQALAKIGARGATGFLIQLVEENPSGSCSWILGHVGEFKNPRFLPLLQRELKNTFVPMLLEPIVRAMGRLGDPRAIETLAGILADDRHYKLHHEAIVALGELGCTDHPELEKARKSKDPSLKYAAFVALGRTRDAISAMKSNGDCQAAAALARSHDEQAIPALIGMLNDARNGVNQHAARSLRTIGWKPTVLDQAISFGLLSADIDLLADCGTAAVPALAAKSQESSVALQALALLPGKSAERPLLAALLSSDAKQRKLAAELLRDFPGETVVSALRSANAKEQDQEIARVIAASLKKLEGID